MPLDQLFYVGQKAIIEKDGEVLVLHDPLMGTDFPGGKVQVGEIHFAKALQREVREETSLEIQVGNPFANGYFEFSTDSGHRNAGKKIYLVVFKCTYISGEVRLSDEHDSFLWVNKENYRKLLSKKWELEILEKYFSG